MANVDNPHGLRPIGKYGADFIGLANPYYVPASYATALFVGDAVVKTGTSNTAAVTGIPGHPDYIIGALPEINLVTVGDGNAITGVVVGFAPLPTDLSKNYNPASTARVVLVLDDPYAIFEIQADGAVPAASIGLNAVLIATHAGSTVTGLSGLELDTTSDVPAADASNQLTILRMFNAVDNEANATWNRVVVKINNHTEAHGVIGI